MDDPLLASCGRRQPEFRDCKVVTKWTVFAKTTEELIEALRNQNCIVPPRNQQSREYPKHIRKNDEETWVACRVLAALANSDLLQYPICIKHLDRPDLVVTLPDDQIGIEITEAVPKNWARVQANENLEDFIPIPPNKIDDPTYSKKDIKKIAKGKFQPARYPSMGEGFERNWLDAMIYIINKKTEKFKNEGFVKKPCNWLFIYDNWAPRPEYSDAIPMLHARLSGSEWKNPFDKILMLNASGCSVWEFTRETDTQKHLVPRDLAQNR